MFINYKNFKILLYILLAFCAGYLANNYKLLSFAKSINKIFSEEIKMSELIKKKKIRGVSVKNDIKGKIEVACPRPESSYVIIGFGQSNSANSAGHRFKTKKNILNFFNGKCYKAEDPMLGTTGNAGSVWIPLAERLDIHGKTIVLATFGVGSSAVSHWLDNNYLLPFYKKNIKKLNSIYPFPNAAVWIQGEADVETPTENFQKELEAWINIVTHDLPKTNIYITGTSYCKGKSNIKILDVQRKIAESYNATYVGSTDTLSQSIYRYDDCHFSKNGILELANLITGSWIK